MRMMLILMLMLPGVALGDSLDDLKWVKRPLVIFADQPEDPRFRQQMAMLEEAPEMLEERGIAVLTDTDPAAKSELRQRLRPRGFSLVLIGLDGQVKLRKPRPWSVRELSRVIDKMPLRLQELERAKEAE